MEDVITVDCASRTACSTFYGRIDGIPVTITACRIDIHDDGFIGITFRTDSREVGSIVYFGYDEFMDKLASGEFVANEAD